jgi:hypothetical protein
MLYYRLCHETHNSSEDLFIDNISGALENCTLEERDENSEKRAFLAVHERGVSHVWAAYMLP